jgi:hypothetical protein
LKKIQSNDVLGPIRKIKNSLPSISEVANKQPEPITTEDVPRITNQTVSIHREDVLKGARKYIYPLSHSKNKIVIITTSIVVVFVLLFFTYCTLGLYRYNSTSQFLYKVTSVIPFPIARVDGHFVSYNNYLFEIQHYIHYYQTEQGVNFSSTSGKEQLLNYEQQALNKVINDAYIGQLASKDHVTVSNSQITNQINVVSAQNRLGNNQSELADVLKTYYGWSINDFKRELKTQLLAQNLVSKLDTATHTKAQSVLSQLNSGTSFSTLAEDYSDDLSTKANGGQYPGTISQNNPSIPAQIMSVLFTLKPGQHSGLINTGSTLEIVENISQHGQQIQAAHISFDFQDINTYLIPLKQHGNEKIYIHIK